MTRFFALLLLSACSEISLHTLDDTKAEPDPTEPSTVTEPGPTIDTTTTPTTDTGTVPPLASTSTLAEMAFFQSVRVVVVEQGDFHMLT